MVDIFKNLELDAWYMVLICLGGLIFVFSLFVPTQWISNKQAILLSSGMLLIGLGEWKNHKYHSWIKPPNVYTGPTAFIQTKVRQSDPLGLILDGIGTILIIFGVLSLNDIF